jgi:hypothetical protein
MKMPNGWENIVAIYSKHPLGFKSCKKCKSGFVVPPAYPNDFFDCLSCGHSFPPSKSQHKKMLIGQR